MNRSAGVRPPGSSPSRSSGRQRAVRALAVALLMLAGASTAWSQSGEPASSASPPESTSTTAAPSTFEAEANRLRAEAEKLDRLAEQDIAATDDREVSSLWPTFVRTVVMLSAVCLLAYLLLGKLMPKILQIEPPAAPRRLLKVIDRLAIDQKRSVMILQLGDEYFMVGAAEQNITLMSKLDAEHVERLLAEAEVAGPRLGRLSDIFVRRPAKGN